jgi:alkanesulfonate monooxygenase SsuD/methylene tetrahydromethanopterin reductase-like flavin-dependent oxidoreductase (luciferase family)
VQKPHPPIWIGGHSRAAFERVVAFGDGWHASSLSPEQMRGHLEALRKVADAAGRPFDQLKLSLRLKLSVDDVQGSHQAIIDQYCAYKALGLSHLALDFRRENLAEMLDTLALLADEIRPAVQAG